MSPKGGQNNKVEADQVLSAVVVADSFNKRFMPLTLEKPRCLLPLLNVPLIEYTLEFLAVSGVQEIYVVCCAHSDQIKDYLKQSRWSKTTVPKVSTIVSQELNSVGDALRDLDAKQILRSDFILVSGDVVSNMNLEKALEEHRTRRLTDKNAIMTMVVKTANPNHRTRARGEEGLYVLDAATSECVHYDSLYPKKRKLNLNLEVFKAHNELQVRNDLIDCQIHICSVDVPALFTENFDYQDVRKHFVRGILESDILGKTIFCHIISDTYAARVRSTQMYDSVSKDIISRWAFPVVPDSNIFGDEAYVYSRPHIYKEKKVILSRSATLERHVVVGSGTEIGENTRVAHSSIGRNCKIGSNVVIENSYIWDDAVIEDNCRVNMSILATGVKLLRGVTVKKGSILSFNVTVGPDFVVPEFSKVTKSRPSAGSDYDDSDAEPESPSDDIVYSHEEVGDEGEGFLWEDRMSDEDDEDDTLRQLEMCSLGREVDLSAENCHLDEETDESDDGSDFGDDLAKSHNEILLTLERAFEENHTVENLVLELNTLKFAANLDFHDLRLKTVPALLNLVKPGLTVKDVINRWGGALAKFVIEPEDQMDVLRIVEDHCAINEAHSKLILQILQAFYQKDIVEEEVIIKWYKISTSKIRDMAKPFVDWLQQAEEESDDDDDDDDDDDED
ncbi:hypothetical protein HDV05_003716 [Chytridiales sp. JEL 0842]|nr:hypothetical protein HDV05_003716 [Chytridiales sp. JEL 0842]